MQKTYIFDIDNTLCDTWPTLRTNKRNLILRFIYETWRVVNIPVFGNMVNCVRLRKKRVNGKGVRKDNTERVIQ